MRIACDVCETAAAAVICCADEAALCARCDEEVHAANKLARKHRRLPLHCETAKLPRCDICQDKSAFVFCVEDRGLLCQDCDEAIHIATSLSAKHQRLLATGISVGFCAPKSQNTIKHHLKPSNAIVPAPKAPATTQTPLASIPSSCAIDDLLQLSEAHGKESSVAFGELPWFADIDFPAGNAAAGRSIAAVAEVPAMFSGDSSNEHFQSFLKSESSMLFKKPRMQALDDDFFTVPDLW